MVTTEPNLKKLHRRKPAFIYYIDVTKIKKTRVGHAWLFITARAHMTPCIACEKVRVN